MLLIILNWFFITFIALSIGQLVLRPFGQDDLSLVKIQEQDRKPHDLFPLSTFLVGLATITAIAQLWSLFLPVTFHLELCLAILSIISLLRPLHQSPTRHLLKTKSFTLKLAYTLPVVLTLLLVAISLMLTLEMTTNIDEAGYYLSLVKWIEQYPVTPGTALLNHRIGFNSSLHMLSAVFSQVDFFKGGLYDINGLLFIFFNLYFLLALGRLIRGTSLHLLADWVLSCALVFPYSYLVDSMDADYLSIMGGIYIHAEVLRYLDPQSQETISTKKLITLTLVTVFLTTVRPFSLFLSGGVIFLWFKKLIESYQEVEDVGYRNEWRIGYSTRGLGHSKSGETWRKALLRGLGYGLSGALLIMLPWLIRNYYMTGYLVFPIYYIDLFHPDWKVRLEVIKSSYDIIGEFAKLQIIREDYLYQGLTYPSFTEWLPRWIDTTKMILIGQGVMIGLPLFILLFLIQLADTFRQKISLSSLHYYNLYVLCIIGLWFVSFPSIRFGWAWILVFLGSVGYYYVKKHSLLFKLSIYILTFLVIISSIRLVYNINWSHATTSPLSPAKIPIEIPYTSAITPSGLTLKYALDPHCYGLNPPCLPYNNPLKIEARGDRIVDGFRLKALEKK